MQTCMHSLFKIVKQCILKNQQWCHGESLWFHHYSNWWYADDFRKLSLACAWIMINIYTKISITYHYQISSRRRIKSWSRSLILCQPLMMDAVYCSPIRLDLLPPFTLHFLTLNWMRFLWVLDLERHISIILGLLEIDFSFNKITIEKLINANVS